MRKRSGPGTEWGLARLMALPREEIDVRPNDLFGDIPAVVIGGVAARAYVPERHTKDIAFLVADLQYRSAIEHPLARGWQKLDDPVFPNSSLGLYGTACERHDAQSIDVIASNQPWAEEALRVEAFDQTGLRVIALPYLVLMKLDSARGIDQADLTRMLRRLDDDGVARSCESSNGIRTIRKRPTTYASLGRLEWGRPS